MPSSTPQSGQPAVISPDNLGAQLWHGFIGSIDDSRGATLESPGFSTFLFAGHSKNSQYSCRGKAPRPSLLSRLVVFSIHQGYGLWAPQHFGALTSRCWRRKEENELYQNACWSYQEPPKHSRFQLTRGLEATKTQCRPQGICGYALQDAWNTIL